MLSFSSLAWMSAEERKKGSGFNTGWWLTPFVFFLSFSTKKVHQQLIDFFRVAEVATKGTNVLTTLLRGDRHSSELLFLAWHFGRLIQSFATSANASV